MPKNVHFTRNFEKRDETRNRDEKREVQNCRDPGKSSRRDETREKHYAGPLAMVVSVLAFEDVEVAR